MLNNYQYWGNRSWLIKIMCIRIQMGYLIGENFVGEK